MSYYVHQSFWATINRVAYKHQKFISSGYGGWEVQGQVTGRFRFLVRTLFLVCRRPVSLRDLLIGEGMKALWGLSSKGITSILEGSILMT